MLSFFPLDVLDEIWDVIESVSGGFLTYSFIKLHRKTRHYERYAIHHSQRLERRRGRVVRAALL